MKDLIKSKAMELGFSAVGITSADPIDAERYLKGAIEEERIAGMGWLARNPEARCDPRSLLPGARSVVCCALAYGDEGLPSHELRVTSHESIARFARGADYHVVVKEKLEGLWKVIYERMPDARCRICVDTSPILEKALAARAGLGWIGKHTVLLNRELGSWFVLGEIITDIGIEPDSPASNMCGECRECIDACPTKAIMSPQELDARKCISYLTIEAPRLASSSNESRVTSHDSYGCDLCQEACPYNLD
jgi:epoxyqueuosine reductase